MTAASNEVVAVIQADREAAANYGAKIGYPDLAIDNIRTGKCDQLHTVVAFARHRIAHSDSRPVAEGLREGEAYWQGYDAGQRAATHSPAPMAGEGLKTARGEAVGIRDALRQEFRTASRGHGRAGTADWLDGPYMAMGDAADVYADLMLGRAASDVGEAFDLDGLKKLWRTGVETGRILQDTHPKAVQIVRDYQTVADAKYLSVKSRIDGGEEGLELTLAVALGLSHQAREIHSRLIAAHPSTQEG